MKIRLCLLMFLPFLAKAQDEGIKFEKWLSWKEVLTKASFEKKYVFVDCYTTWCGPCKVMDRYVYVNEKVGNCINDNFISIKVQMDTSLLDNEETKKRYAVALEIQQQYKVLSFPSYLFFSSDGKLVHRDVGYKNINDFITVASNAVVPSKQYYTLLEDYQRGIKNYREMAYLALTTKAINEPDLANRIARDYTINYLDKLKGEDLFVKSNIEFIKSFIGLITSKDKAFDIFYRYQLKIDRIMEQEGFSQGIVDYVIAKEEVTPKLYLDNSKNNVIDKPNWNQIISTITKKYGKSYAERIVINAQLRFYSYKKDWAKLTKYNIKKIETYGIDTTNIGRAFVNNMIWEVIFEHNTNALILNKGIKWMEILIKCDPNNPSLFDTYANLLYKKGRRKEALIMEERAVKLEESNASKLAGNPDKVYEQTLEKMRIGEPTWPLN